MAVTLEIAWRDAGICYRSDGHSGPCNGVPRPGCLRPSCPTCGPMTATEVLARRAGTWKAPLRQRTSEERKGEPVYTGCMMYFPDALAAISRLSKAGNDKHNPGEPLHWARGKSADQMDCAARHMLAPTEVDPDNREADLVAAAWRLLAELQLAEEKRLAAMGIMPYSGIVP